MAADVQEEPQEQLLPPVVDDELMRENHGGQQNLISALTGVLDIDDDNEPVPENVPGDPVPSVLSTVWGHYGFCYRKSNNLADTKARLVNNVDTTRDDVNLQLFERLFPRKYVEDVILTETNKVLDKEPVTYGEFALDGVVGVNFYGGWIGSTFLLVVEVREHVRRRPFPIG